MFVAQQQHEDRNDRIGKEQYSRDDGMQRWQSNEEEEEQPRLTIVDGEEQSNDCGEQHEQQQQIEQIEQEQQIHEEHEEEVQIAMNMEEASVNIEEHQIDQQNATKCYDDNMEEANGNNNEVSRANRTGENYNESEIEVLQTNEHAISNTLNDVLMRANEVIGENSDIHNKTNENILASLPTRYMENIRQMENLQGMRIKKPKYKMKYSNYF